MIARRWTGTVRADRADAYIRLMNEIAIPDYRRIAGNLGAFCLAARRGDAVDVTMLTFWKDMTAVRSFAGPSPHVAKYYDFDAEYLLSMSAEAEHAEIEAGEAAPEFGQLITRLEPTDR